MSRAVSDDGSGGSTPIGETNVNTRVQHLSATVFVTAILAMVPAARAQDTKAMDLKIDKAIVETINLGVPLYNSGDHYGCYRSYEGAAILLVPYTSTRPGLEGVVEAGLKKAEAQPRYDLRAAVLRETLDQVRDVLAGKAKALWDRLGGETAVKAVVHDFVVLAAGDPKVDFTRGGKFPLDSAGVANLEQKLVELISANTGGPFKYTGRDMKSAHAGMGITEAEFNAIAGDLITVLKKYKVPKKEMDELVAIVASTKKDIVEAAAAPKTLFDRLGGLPAITAVVDDFVGRAASDPKVNFTRKGTPAEWKATPESVAHLKEKLVELIAETTGGPVKYTGRDMKSTHKGMGITEAEFNAIAADLKATLDKFKVPAKEQDELFAIVGSTKADIVEVP
jgi:truncated hemoglobin YjbI